MRTSFIRILSFCFVRYKWRSLLVLMLCFLSHASYSNEREERLIWAGLDLFPSLIAADADIKQKIGPDGSLVLVLIHNDLDDIVKKMAQHLEKIEKIRGIPIHVKVTNDLSLKTFKDRIPAAIFLIQRIRDLKPIIQYGKDHHIIVFSPYEEDVKQGVLGGMMIRDTILPFINMKTMRDTGIRIKPFFMEITKKHE